MAVTIALAGDVMLGRKVAERLDADPRAELVDATVAGWLADADLTVVNLECCVSARGRRWPDPAKPFFFRAPPQAADRLAELGVDAVTLANNHALDYGADALADTVQHLARVGVAAAGAGADVSQARRPALLDAGGARVALLGVADHPADFAAGRRRPGIAFADLRAGVPRWLVKAVGDAAREADWVLLGSHWGPNMVPAPVAHVRRAARELVAAGAAVVAGHSAHVPHGVAAAGGGVVCHDLGDFLDDYAVHPQLRNDLGFVWRVTVDEAGPRRVEARPIALDFCHTRPADGAAASWLRGRLVDACAALGAGARDDGDRVVVDLTADRPPSEAGPGHPG